MNLQGRYMCVVYTSCLEFRIRRGELFLRRSTLYVPPVYTQTERDHHASEFVARDA